MDEELGATAEVLEVAAEEQAVSMDDTIRNTLHEMRDRGVETDPQDAETPPSPEEKAARIRDGQGKFAAKPAEAAAAPVEAAPVSTAPNTWKKEASDAWLKADPVIRAEVERREADFHRGIEQYKGKAQFADAINNAITPHMQTLNSLGIAPEKAIGELMAADARLRYGTPQDKQAYFAQLAQSYGIDLAGAQQDQRQIDPNVSAANQRIAALEGRLQQQDLMGQQKEQASLNSEIETFAADPSHSHFESVKGHMSALLQAGMATGLTDAYEQAVYANPTTRAAMLQQQADATRAENAKKAQAARNAAGPNVRARPSMPVSQPIGSMDDTIRNTLRKLQGS